MGVEFICEYCGAEVQKRRNDHQYKYCSRDCYYNARFGMVISDEIPAMRSPLCLEALELCRLGLNRAEAAKRVGIKRSVLNDWFYKYGANSTAEVFADRVCLCCGKSLAGMSHISSRKYCSKKCGSKAAYLRKYPIPTRMKFDPELRSHALELYWGGLEGTLIARHLDISIDTVHSWIHDFGCLRKRKRNPELMKLLPINLRIESAASSKEWRWLLRENAPAGDDSPIIIVCGSRNGNGGVNCFVSVIFDRLKRNPCDGMTYAFCSSNDGQISTICWKRDAFHLTKMPKAKGGYIWPENSVGTAIELRKNEFDFLLSLSKKRGAKPYFT